MSQVSKTQNLHMLSTNLEVFFPNLKGYFKCPICLTEIGLHEEKIDKDRIITEAHIIPQAVKGKLTTYLCNKCNNTFGSQQDKWFGEWIRLANQETPTMLATNIRDGYFEIDGVRIHGDWAIDAKKHLCFYMHKDRNSPKINELIEKKFREAPSQIKVQVPLPLLRHQKMIEIGFLTAGYLMWFHVLGYSWVFQRHLEPIREQILNPGKDILKARFLAYCEHVKWLHPWIGVIRIANEITLVTGLENFLVVFPPVDQPQVYSKLGNNFAGLSGSNIRPLRFSKPYYGPAVCVTLDNRILVAPDAVMQRNIPNILIHFDTEHPEPQILYPLAENKIDQYMQNPEAIIRHIDMRPIEERNQS